MVTATGMQPVLVPRELGADDIATEGDRVEAGATVATIEAMKTEAAITAPVAGTVRRAAVTGPRAIEGGDLVLVIG